MITRLTLYNVQALHDCFAARFHSTDNKDKVTIQSDARFLCDSCTLHLKNNYYACLHAAQHAARDSCDLRRPSSATCTVHTHRPHTRTDSAFFILIIIVHTVGWRGGLVVGRRTCDLVVAGSRPGRDAAA